MFRRTQTPPTDQAHDPKPDGKGRPTPSRKEAQAAARERARAGIDKKAAQKLVRERRTAANRKMREGIKAGEEKYLPVRDQGPVRRYIRDWVDSRITFTEFMLPLLLLIMALMYLGSGAVKDFGATLQSVTLLVVVVDILMMNFRLKRALKARFPDESPKGTFFYALMRALQLRFMRMPKTAVKLGQPPR